MIKRHKITGLLYFCKTARFDPNKYLGSGKYWRRHLKVHGKVVETVWLELFTEQDFLIEFATFFSEFNNIVSATDSAGNKLWANLEIENGMDGMPVGTNRGLAFKEKSKINNTGKRNPSYGKYWWTDGYSEIKSTDCPKGWKRGRSLYIKEHLFVANHKTGHYLGKNNPSYGKKWWTNGVDTVKSLECPDGWYNGTGSKHREKCKNKLTKV